LIDEWVREVPFLDLRAEAASAQALPDGRDRVNEAADGKQAED
jgi:hypothetical protein